MCSIISRKIAWLPDTKTSLPALLGQFTLNFYTSNLKDFIDKKDDLVVYLGELSIFPENTNYAEIMLELTDDEKAKLSKYEYDERINHMGLDAGIIKILSIKIYNSLLSSRLRLSTLLK